MDTEPNENHTGDVRTDPPEILEPLAGANAHDIQGNRTPQAHKGREQHVAPVIGEAALSLSHHERRDRGGRNQEIRVVHDVADPVTPTTEESVGLAEGMFGPLIHAP